MVKWYSIYVITLALILAAPEFRGTVIAAEDLPSNDYGTIQEITLEDEEIVLQENFEAGLPDDWTILDGFSDGKTWGTENPSGWDNPSWTGTFMLVDSDYAGDVQMDESLVTPVLNMSQYSAVVLEFDHYFCYWWQGTDEIGAIDVRIGDGQWRTVKHYEGENFSGHEIVNLSFLAGHQEQVQIRWRYIAKADFYWGIDDVKVLGGTLPPLVGDFDEDGIVNFDDLGIFAQMWLLKSSDPRWDNRFDLDNDGSIIDIGDVLILAEHWLETGGIT